MSISPFTMRVVRSDGAEMSFGDGTEWVLSMNDMGDWIPLDISVTTSANVLTDGSSLVSKRVEEKDRTTRAVYWGRDRESARERVMSFFNPKFSFEMHLTYMGRTRWCAGEIAAFDCPIADYRTPVQATWTVLCMDPWMKSEDGNFNSLTDSVPMFGFPFVSHVRQVLPNGERYPVGFNASIMIYDGRNVVNNQGDVDAYYVIHCEFNGPANNPTFTKDDKRVRVLSSFSDGDVLDIDFTAAPPTVEVNGKNAIQLCSRDSDFVNMQMQPGENIFQYTCDDVSNRPNMDVQIRFYSNYLGV